jgi:hypothetical protein
MVCVIKNRMYASFFFSLDRNQQQKMTTLIVLWNTNWKKEGHVKGIKTKFNVSQTRVHYPPVTNFQYNTKGNR